MTTPDGMPIVWARKLARAPIDRVCGPELLPAVCGRGAEVGWRMFLYGGDTGVADRLAAEQVGRYPGLRVVGTFTPPFRPLEPDEDASVRALIAESGADIVWVGLSTPKQERWMAAHVGGVGAPVLIGVGAAFDMHAGLVRRAPGGVRRTGFEWVYRLALEPRRLWRRYLSNNPRFVLALLRRRPRLVRG
jgi:N-acetylglucosaminyldiphosphoundecaprenol N-acetyl-beta-D-mannosaminyltransferase